MPIGVVPESVPGLRPTGQERRAPALTQSALVELSLVHERVGGCPEGSQRSENPLRDPFRRVLAGSGRHDREVVEGEGHTALLLTRRGSRGDEEPADRPDRYGAQAVSWVR